MTETAAPATAPVWATHWTALALAELPADITTATPPQVDEVIRTVELERVGLADRIRRAFADVRKAVGQTYTEAREGYGRNRETVTTWSGSPAEAIDAARTNPGAENADWHARAYRDLMTVGDALAVYDAAIAQDSEAYEWLVLLNDEFDRRGGWTRFYRVDNTGGHVHTERTCRTTYATTRWNWPTQLSGADGAQVVDAAGPLTCLACFPNEREDILAGRPVRFDAFETRPQRVERERREAELATRNAAKIAKGVTPDGSKLVVVLVNERYNETVELKTERAAELRYVEWAAITHNLTVKLRNCPVDRREEYTAKRIAHRDAAAEIVEALAWKRGMTPAAVVEALAPKVTKKAAALYY